MNEILLQLGLNVHEAAIYLLLLKQPGLTANAIAEACAIKRTNTYRLLDHLETQGLVLSKEDPIKQFSAAEPRALRALLQDQQTKLSKAATSLASAMPLLRSQYSLSLDKPGVFHMAGDEGLEQLLMDMSTSRTEVLLVASDAVPLNKDTLSKFRNLIAVRQSSGIKTRALFHNAAYSPRVRKELEQMGMEVRLIGTAPYEGEMVVYEDNVVFSVYEPSTTVTIITNKHIAATMKTMFEELWTVAAP